MGHELPKLRFQSPVDVVILLHNQTSG